VTILAHVDIAMATLQDIFVVPIITKLTTEAPSRCADGDAFELSRILALVILLEFGEDSID
jgi:hypothetical protein